ncbi:MAG TPA: glycosyltransferase family 2 protein [Clostridia bacterium]|nr:glycosyltransferase family 2 protein [Clostridia bacterium]
MSSTETLFAADAAEATGTAKTRFPFVTVVVPTYNRAKTLPHVFASLAKQNYPADRMELIVVDNSSSDDTEDVVERWKQVLPFRARFYRKDNKGPAASRNYGAARAEGEIIAFTDSDCILSADWIRNAAEAFRDGVGLVCGPFLPVPRENEGLLVAQQSPITNDRGCYPTANLFIRKVAFDQVGGFDERYGLYPWGELIAGEDADVAWRVKRSGWQSEFVPTVVVCHLSTPITLKRMLLRPVVVQIIPALLPKIPELRDTYLWRRYFNGKVDLYFFIALLGVVAALVTHWWLLALAVLPWIGFHARYLALPAIRSEGLARGLARSLIYMYLQAGCAIVLVFASIRYRRLVL